MKIRITDQNSVAVSKDMYGLFFEDINYSLDGGLHAEMLENRNFEAVFAFGKKDDFGTVYDGGYGWLVYEDNGAGSFMSFDSSEPVNQVNPHYMVFMGRGEKPSFTNKAYDGLYMQEGISCHSMHDRQRVQRKCVYLSEKTERLLQKQKFWYYRPDGINMRQCLLRRWM